MSEQQYNANNVTNLAQLKAALLRAHGEVSELAGIVVGVLEDMILQADIRIAASAWSENTDATTKAQGYDYKADVGVAGLIENANVNVTFDVPSLAVAAAARLCRTEHISAGSVRFFAKTIPTAALTAKLDAIQLDESGEQADEQEGG